MIIDSLARFATEDPRRIALIANSTSVTYADLWRGIGILETRIKEAAIPRGARVGVAIADLRLAWFAILALEKLDYPGFAVPQNARLSSITFANLGAILTDGRPYGTSVLDTSAPVVDVSSGSNAPSPGIGGSPRATLERFILFSSGTTGHHKKIQFNAALRDSRIESVVQQKGYNSGTRHFLGNVGPWTFHGYSAPLAIWSQGGAIVTLQSPDPVSAIAAARPNRIFLTPGLAESLLRLIGARRLNAQGVTIALGGGAVYPALYANLKEAFQGAMFEHSYASTESGSIAKTPIAAPEDLASHLIGAHADIQIVDPGGAELARGQTGAIRVRTPTSVHGYLDDPAATAAFFRDGWFYPGDMGFIGNDGRLVLTGRFTEVINMRGDKIAPGLLEEPIKKAISAREVAVLSRPSPGMLDELHVFVVEGPPLTRDLMATAIKPFSGAFSKVQVHRSKGLPRNTMGKILYGQLRSQLEE